MRIDWGRSVDSMESNMAFRDGAGIGFTGDQVGTSGSRSGGLCRDTQLYSSITRSIECHVPQREVYSLVSRLGF